MKTWKIKSYDFDLFTVLLLVLTIAAFLMRLYQVDFLTLWVDEYVHVDRARYFPESPLFTDDNNGILLTMFILPLFKLFEVSAFWARFPSVVFGTLLVPMIYLFAKKYFNRNTAILSATLVTFSTYLVFWSRLSRNYAVFAFFFLLMLYFLGRAINVDDSFKQRKNRILNYLKWQPKYWGVALIVLFLSILSHQLTFLVIYGIMFYHLALFIDNLFHKRFNFLSIEAIITYFLFIFSAVIFVPSVQEIFKSVLLLFLPQNVANWVLPDLARLSELMKTEPYKTFQIYFGVLKHDYNSIYWLGFAGFIHAMIRYRKAGYFITSVFLILFLIMSFVFREPSLPRYLIYIYPLFLVSLALCVDMLLSFLRKIKIKTEYAVLAAVVIICFLPTAKASVKMVESKEHGRVADSHLSAFYFPNWKTSLMRIKSRFGKDDILISTMTAYVDFYLDKKSYHFRQRRYDSTAHQYVNFPVDTVNPNANSTQAVAKLLDNSDKAWLVADYYFNNVMTDPETRSYIISRMKFEYGMSNQYVSVFSYDKTNPNTCSNMVFEYIHSENMISMAYQFERPTGGNMVLLLDLEGIFYDNEAIIMFNNAHSVGILQSQGALFRKNGDSKSRQVYAVPIPPGIITPGRNTFEIGLNNNSLYEKCRFVLYNMGIQAE